MAAVLAYLEGAQRIDGASVLRKLEGNSDVRLGAQMVHLRRVKEIHS
jgi:hypothetical protein